MPMPYAHVEQLRDLNDALAILSRLSKPPRDGEQLVLDISDFASFLRDPVLKSTIDRFHDSKEAREEAARNGTAYFRKHGVRVPEHMAITVVDNNWRVSACVKLVVFGVGIEYGAHYDSETGWGWGC